MPSSPSHRSATDAKHAHRIELKLRDVGQLFNSMDPSPFIEKDLDDDAEEYIVSWAQEFPPGASIKLRIHLDQWPAEDPSAMIEQAVHNYFAHRAKLTAAELRALMRQGRTSLLIGMVFLAGCLLVINALLRRDGSTWAIVLRESLTIAGWVAMWRPMQIYLYDWWPLRRKGRVYTKLSEMPVEVLPRAKG
ncbi:MAG: hypothetical protein ACRELB_15975 [Polyangiaceae bacterium]